MDQNPISGLTHRFYRYPARFSPQFARTAIERFSQPGSLVLDPFMGGATTLLEALVAGRRAVGCDVNELAVFVACAKTTQLTGPEVRAVERWAEQVVPRLLYNVSQEGLASLVSDPRVHNLQMPAARPIKKAFGLALAELNRLPSSPARNFVRCAMLNAGQWALNGRKRAPSLKEFRNYLRDLLMWMLTDLNSLDLATGKAIVVHGSAARLHAVEPFCRGELADLVVTSPPYPGIHMLYHRWQVDGRRETPAPYWITNCSDGKGSSYYTFGDRQTKGLNVYFETALHNLRGLRRVLKHGAYVIQLIAFSDAPQQLPRYLAVMNTAGFAECRPRRAGGSLVPRTWRPVPGRKWHAMSKGHTPASREVVIIHRAI